MYGRWHTIAVMKQENRTIRLCINVFMFALHSQRQSCFRRGEQCFRRRYTLLTQKGTLLSRGGGDCIQISVSCHNTSVKPTRFDRGFFLFKTFAVQRFKEKALRSVRREDFRVRLLIRSTAGTETVPFPPSDSLFTQQRFAIQTVESFGVARDLEHHERYVGACIEIIDRDADRRRRHQSVRRNAESGE